MELQNITFNIPKIKSLQGQSPKTYLNMSNPIDTFEKRSSTFEDTLKELSNIKKDGQNRFTDSEIQSFSRLAPEKINNVKHFAQTNLSSFNIKWIVEKNDVNFEKLGNMIADMEKSNKNPSISFTDDSAAAGNFILSAVDGDKEQTRLLDKNLNILSTENTVTKGDNKITEVQDLRNNTNITIKTDKKGVLLNEVKTYKDKNGNITKTQYTEPSEIDGVYNIKVKTADGKTEIISEGKIDKQTGISTVKKNMTSLDGTKTEYFYQTDSKGNRNSTYKITDKKGKVLLNNVEKFNIISDKNAVSEKNGEKYEMTYGDNKISIKNKDKTVEIDLNKFAYGDFSPMLKLSGNELIQMKNNVTKYGGSRGSFAAYDVFSKAVNTSDNGFATLLHELGHAKDYRNKDMEISGDETFVKTFEEEKKAFTNEFSNAERNMIQYFIRPKCHHAGVNGGKVETVAEVNALLNSCADENETAMRKQMLQQYFPKTIAVLNEKLNKLSDTPLQVSSNESFGH